MGRRTVADWELRAGDAITTSPVSAIIERMAEFLAHNVNAVFGLIGVLVGVLVSGAIQFLTSWALRNRDLHLKIWERFLDRRISAHDKVVGLAMKMRVMVTLGAFDPDGELARAPRLMSSKETFDEWLTEFANESVPATTWLATAVKRELSFVQDYMVTLHTHLSPVPSEHFLKVGRFIRQDFIDLSSNLEKIAFEFFKLDSRKLNLGDLTEHHKYVREETERRFQGTVMMGKWAEFHALVQSLGAAEANNVAGANTRALGNSN